MTMSREKLKEKRRRAGRLGGLATREKYGLSFYKVNGARGGRPRAQALDEVLSQQQSLRSKEEARRRDTPGASLPEGLNALKRLWLARRRTSGAIQET